MTTLAMSFERFSELLDSRGATLARWPAGDRQAAEALLAISPEAADRLAEAARLDDDLRAGMPKAPAGLVDRIMAASGAAGDKRKS